MHDLDDILTRRRFIAGTAALSAAAALAACGGDDGDGDANAMTTAADDGASTVAATPDGTLAATPACDDGDEETLEQTEGPYFTPNSPLRRSLLTAGMAGTRLVLAGRVLTPECRPLRQALVDFWQADARGVYDNSGYRLRGHQFTDSAGRYRLSTVIPGLYPGRTRHIHVKVQPRGGQVLTTQLYFPGVARNATDGIYDEALLMSIRRNGAARAGRFDFVIDV